MRFADASAYEILWADAVVVETVALEGGTTADAAEPAEEEGKADV